MYTDDYRPERFPYRDFLIKLSIILLIVIFLIFLSIKFFNSRKQSIDNSEEFAEVFSANLQKMKNASLTYLTEEKLPKEINESKKISLELLIKEKKLTPIVDGNKTLCNQKSSYIKITKKEEEYTLKVNLVCQEDSDYIITHLNHYDYCKNTYLCEKENNKTKEEIENKDPENIEESMNQSINTNSKQNIKIKTKSQKNTSTNKKKIIPPKGTIIIKDTTNNKYLYEYKKITNLEFSTWSSWNNWEKTSCQQKEITCNKNDLQCEKEIKRYNRKENIGVEYKDYYTTKISLKYKENEYIDVCNNEYNYLKIDQSIFKTRGNYSEINNDSITQKNKGDWIYTGRASYQSSPKDTTTIKYLLVGPDYSVCNNTCEKSPNYYYDKYIYNQPITQTGSYTDNCSSITKKRVPIYHILNENIHNKREETLYGTVCYKSERTRTVKKQGKTSIKWSTYNDKKLLNEGYSYTGRKKRK